MATGEQYYEKVADDEGAEGSSSRLMRAPPTTKKSTLMTRLATLAIAVTVFLVAVAAGSSIMVTSRLPEAIQAAIEREQGSASATPAASEEKTDTKETNNYKLGDAAAPIISYNLTTHQEFTNCGSTPDEARKAGCVFDAMMQLWTPSECMDTHLSDKFLKDGNWTFYKDGDATEAFSDEELRKGDHDIVYVVQSYYRHHCIFAWERLVRAMRAQSPLIQELISYDWVLNCRARTLVLPDEVTDPSEDTTSLKGVVALTGYANCASYDVWLHSLPYDKLSSVY